MATALPRLTYDDLQRLPDDGTRYELIEGEPIVVASPSRKHQRLSQRLERLLDGLLLSSGWGEMYHAPFDVRLAADVVVQPDILVVRRERLRIVTEALVEGPPDLIVEILSPSSRERDLERKAALYARYGVREYWTVDPDARSVLVRALVDGAYRLLPPAGGVARSRELPGFEVEVAALFAGL